MQIILFTNMGVFSMQRVNNLNCPGCRSRRCAAVWNDSREQNKKDSAFIMATAKCSIKVKECPVWVELNNVSAPGAAITSLCELLHMSRPLVLQQLTHTVGSLIRVLVSENLWISAPGVFACQFLLSVQLCWANEEWQFPSLDSVAIPHFLKGIQID